MRIVYLNPSAQLGGAEVSLLDILTSLRDAEPDWSLNLIVADNGPLVLKARGLGITTIVVPFPPMLARLGDAGVGGPSGNQIGRLALLYKLLVSSPAVIRYISQLRNVIRGLNADIIHTNGFKMHILGVWARVPRSPVIWHVHDYVSLRPIMARLMRLNARRCSAIVANSKSVSANVRSICHERTKVYTVYNGVDLERFSPSGPKLDLDLLSGLEPADAGTLRVGLLATLGRWKGHRIFLKALSLLPPRVTVRGYVIGGAIYQTDGSQHTIDELRTYATQLGVSHKVGFTGYVENPDSAIRALDIVVHASTQPEPFGLVIAEAMACGKALIASQSGGAAEIIHVGVDAIGHASGDAEDLAECIKQLAMNSELREALAKAARSTAEAQFNRSRLARDLIPIYRETVC
jgi:glycosyltransferase involved in cell wall biosynthesis